MMLIGLLQCIRCTTEQPHISISEPVDTLFVVTHDVHVRRLRMITTQRRRNARQHLILERIGVLKLIDHDIPHTFAERRGNRRIREQLERVVNHVVEIDCIHLSLQRAIAVARISDNLFQNVEYLVEPLLLDVIPWRSENRQERP